METQVLFKITCCKIEYIPESDYLIIRWYGFPKSNEFRQACDMALNYMIELNIKKLLTDNREVKVFGVSDQKWLNEEWFPKALALGYYASATLISNDVFVKSAISKIISTRKDSKVRNKSFNNEIDALNWLNSI